jgi:hypothetical protein
MSAITVFPKDASQLAAFQQFLAAFHIPYSIESEVTERLKEAFKIAKSIEKGENTEAITWDDFMSELQTEGYEIPNPTTF